MSNDSTASIMTGVRFILVLTALLAWHGLARGQDIAEMQAKVDTQLAEIASLKSALADREQAATRFDTDLARLRASIAELEQRKAQALEAMNAQFQRIIADPTLDFSSTQIGYRDALEALQSHQSAVKAKQTEIAATRQQIERIEADTKTAERRLTEIRVGFDVARAERLYRELNVEGSIQLNNTIRCKPDETIAACMQRGSDAALQEAKQRFNERIYASVTEAALIAPLDHRAARQGHLYTGSHRQQDHEERLQWPGRLLRRTRGTDAQRTQPGRSLRAARPHRGPMRRYRVDCRIRRQPHGNG